MSEDTRNHVRYSVYGTTAPDAAKFGVGAKSLADIQKATNARRQLSSEQSTPKTGPVRKD